MKMKKYNAPSLAEAMKLVSADLGEDAIILSSKVVVKKKFLGLVKQKSFEVTAGLDPVTRPSRPKIPTFEPPVKQVKPAVEPKSVLQSDDTMISSELKKEIADLKLIMQTMHRQSAQSHYPDHIVQFVEYLRQQELNEELITAIGDELFVHYKNNHGELSVRFMQKLGTQYLTQKMSHLPIEGLSYEKKYINILGPTGVGKTTTIAKMAARAVLEQKKKVGFITTDTYRIAAIEQLKTYAGLLQAPVEIVYNATDYEAAIRKLAHLDMIFIDTAGRNYKEAKYVDDLRNLIKFDHHVESYLVLSLTAKERDLETIIEQFEGLSIDKFIFTKLDETNSIGTMFNLMIKYNKGLAYYTNGQEVPEDIEQPSLEGLFELFFQGE
ncbi:MAG: flagellar biosynthesis protein FlhF [Solibacillus sp.]